jgi:hypothetical protein
LRVSKFHAVAAGQDARLYGSPEGRPGRISLFGQSKEGWDDCSFAWLVWTIVWLAWVPLCWNDSLCLAFFLRGIFRCRERVAALKRRKAAHSKRWRAAIGGRAYNGSRQRLECGAFHRFSFLLFN